MAEDSQKGGVAAGLLFVGVLAVATHFIHGFLPQDIGSALGKVVLGMGLGLIIGNAWIIPPRLQPGIQLCFSTILKISIVLLGARISLQQIAGIGPGVLLLIVGLITLALVTSRTLCSFAGVPCKLGALIGLGAAICGNTAITVAAPIIHAKDEHVSFAIAVNTLFGTFAVFFYPLFASWLQLPAEFYGIWAGSAVNDTSQVVAAGYAYGNEAGDLAVTVKLTRNALMGFVLIVIGFLYADEATGEEISWKTKLKKSAPTFIIGFLAMVVLNSLGLFDYLSRTLDHPVDKSLTSLAKWMILLALIGVGLNTRLGKLREVGMVPFAIGLVVAVLGSVTSFFSIKYLIL